MPYRRPVSPDLPAVPEAPAADHGWQQEGASGNGGALALEPAKTAAADPRRSIRRATKAAWAAVVAAAPAEGRGTRRTGPARKEHYEQADVVSWAALMSRQWPALRLLFGVPNAAKRSARLAAYMKAEGLQSGVPDLWLPVARQGKHGLVIEMKRAKGGVVAASQAAWIAALRAEGYRVEVCHGAAEAIDVLRDYIGADKSRTDT